MKQLARWAGLALLGAAAIWLLRDFVALTLAPWLIQWTLRLASALSAIPSVLLWLLFLLLLGQVLLYSAMQLLATFWARQRPAATPVASIPTPGQVEELARWINQSGRGPLFQQRLARYVTRLALEVMGHDEVVWREAHDLLTRQGDTLPPAVAAYLQLGLERTVESDTTPPPPVWQRWWNRPSAGRPDPQLPDVITFLEKQMEV